MKIDEVLHWISVEERLPEPGRNVLVYYLNSLGNYRIVKAAWIPKFHEESSPEYDELDTEYNDETDAFYWPEGWYERIDNWDDFSSIGIYQGEIAYWMHLPEPPEDV